MYLKQNYVFYFQVSKLLKVYVDMETKPDTVKHV